MENEHPDIASYLVNERRSNELLRVGEFGFIPGEEVHAVLEGLVRQMPNRIYVGRNGRVGRVLLYSDKKEGFKNAAYMQVIESEPELVSRWKNFKAENFVASSRQAIEDEIVTWRNRYGLAVDLVRNPGNVYIADGFPRNSNVYAHSVFEGAEKITSYYFITAFNVPYYIGLHRGENSGKPEVTLSRIAESPREILHHADFLT